MNDKFGQFIWGCIGFVAGILWWTMFAIFFGVI